MHAVPADVLEEHLVLPIRQPADGLPIRRVVRVALGQLDASRSEEAPHAVEPTLAVDVPAVVLVGVERHERFRRAIRARARRYSSNRRFHASACTDAVSVMTPSMSKITARISSGRTAGVVVDVMTATSLAHGSARRPQ